jgi:hypothetical protein
LEVRVRWGLDERAPMAVGKHPVSIHSILLREMEAKMINILLHGCMCVMGETGEVVGGEGEKTDAGECEMEYKR